MHIGRIGVSLGLIGSMGTALAVDFSSLSQAGTGFFSSGGSVTQEGYTFTALGGTTLGVWGNADANHPSGGTTSTSLLNYFAFSTLDITSASGGLFDLTSIAIAPWGAGQDAWVPSFDVTFTGDQFGGGIVNQTVTVTNTTPPALQSFSLSGFTNLLDISVQQGAYTGTGTAWQIDDLGLTSAVPEGNTLALFGVGVVGLFALRRGR